MSEATKKLEAADAAVRLMNRNGYGRVTMTQIEEDVFQVEDTPDCPAPSGEIYKLFTSKEEVAVDWLILTMERAFEDVEKRVSGFGQETVKIFLNTLFDVWLRKLTQRRVFIEGFAASLVVRGSLERRAIDRFVDRTHELLQAKFIDVFQARLSIPPDDDRWYERQAVFSVQAALALATLFWLQDRTSSFNDSYRLTELLADLVTLTLSKQGGGGSVDRGLLQVAYELRELLVDQTALASLEKVLPEKYLEKLPWNVVKLLYKKDS